MVIYLFTKEIVMFFYIGLLLYAFYIMFWPSIRLYLWNKKSPEEKHNAFQAELCRQDPTRPFYPYHTE